MGSAGVLGLHWVEEALPEDTLLLRGAGSVPGCFWPRCLRGPAYLLLEGQEPVQVGLELIRAGLHR